MVKVSLITGKMSLRHGCSDYALLDNIATETHAMYEKIYDVGS